MKGRWGNRVGMLYLAHKILREKKYVKKCYPWALLSLSCLAHGNFYNDLMYFTKVQSSICSLTAQCSLNFNETQFPKFPAKCTYPTNVAITNFTHTFGWRKNCRSKYFHTFSFKYLRKVSYNTAFLWVLPVTWTWFYPFCPWFCLNTPTT